MSPPSLQATAGAQKRLSNTLETTLAMIIIGRRGTIKPTDGEKEVMGITEKSPTTNQRKGERKDMGTITDMWKYEKNEKLEDRERLWNPEKEEREERKRNGESKIGGQKSGRKVDVGQK